MRLIPSAASDFLYSYSARQLYDTALAASFAEVMSAITRPASNAKQGITKALGDADRDVAYTPVTPCRVVETRGTFAAVYQGGRAFSPNEIRNYTIQGGNGVCLTQLPSGLNPSAVQLQVFGIRGDHDGRELADCRRYPTVTNGSS